MVLHATLLCVRSAADDCRIWTGERVELRFRKKKTETIRNGSAPCLPRALPVSSNVFSCESLVLRQLGSNLRRWKEAYPRMPNGRADVSNAWQPPGLLRERKPQARPLCEVASTGLADQRSWGQVSALVAPGSLLSIGRAGLAPSPAHAGERFERGTDPPEEWGPPPAQPDGSLPELEQISGPKSGAPPASNVWAGRSYGNNSWGASTSKFSSAGRPSPRSADLLLKIARGAHTQLPAQRPKPPLASHRC